MSNCISNCNSCSSTSCAPVESKGGVVNSKGQLENSSTTNACKVCAPLGASLVFKGIRGCIPLVHGSQGCATYIRRYVISHFREPLDIASSNFTEAATVFGGQSNFELSIKNIINQYKPEVIGIATTCLSETIGDDVSMFVKNFRKKNLGMENMPKFVTASTASYQGSHMEGFHTAVKGIVCDLAEKPLETTDKVNIFPGFVSAEDLRQVKQIFEDFELEYIMVPDYSETMDSPTWNEYHKLPPGGVPAEEIGLVSSSTHSVEFGYIINKGHLDPISAAEHLEDRYGVTRHNMGLPIGIKETDKFFEALETISGKDTPDKYKQQRGRLVDSYIDGHKYLFGKKAVVYGEEDFVLSMVSFLEEIGIETIVAGTGGESGMLTSHIRDLGTANSKDILVKQGVDFEQLDQIAHELKPDLFIGNSKGYYIARKLSVPIVRCGFPIHDRIGAQRVMHLGYEGTQQLYDKICNAMMEYKQDNSPVGYKYV